MKKCLLHTILILFALSYCYAPVFNNGFITSYDDDDYIIENSNIQNGINLKTVLWAFSNTHSANFHPVTWLAHAADISLFGLDPAGHHLTSVLIHLINTILIYVFFVF